MYEFLNYLEIKFMFVGFQQHVALIISLFSWQFTQTI